MTPEYETQRLVVVSDLHLAPPGEHCVFAAHAPLVALIEHLLEAPAAARPQWLVLNGDVFDFLQIPGYAELSLPLAPQRMADMLDALDAEPVRRNVVRALRRFTAAGHVLCCLPGNHDAELNLVSVQQVLAQRVGSSSALLPSAGAWSLQVAGQLVRGLHGHHQDAFNAISGAQMRKAQADGDAEVPMPPGSRLVCQVINPFRRAKTPDGQPRFPFIDRLPSDQAVLLAILLLDPRLAAKRLIAALGIGAAALMRKALWAARVRRPTLSSSPAALPIAPAEPEWLDVLTEHVAAAVTEMPKGEDGTIAELEHQLDAYFAGYGRGTTRGSDSLAGGDGPVRGLLLRAFGRALAATRERFQSGTADDLALRMSRTAPAGVVTITGHTHAAKSLRWADGRVYLNTGTWLDQIVPPPHTELSLLSAWLDSLQNGALPSWNGYPVALVDGAGARLMRWDGSGMGEWRDALP